MDLWELENELYDSGIACLCGVDEAGRGPLAGPVCAAACILPRNLQLEGLNDSKKLTEKRREVLFEQIKAQAVSYGIAFATVEEIEELNILGATYLAMNRAIAQLHPTPELALIDGNRNTGIEVPSRSILAKVTRDRYMTELDETYPEYGFAKHKGYGTKAHYAALREYGPSPVHRPTFLRKMH